MDPMTASLIAGTVSSFFGPKPKYTAGQKLQLDVARQFQRMGNAVPLSSPDELAGLAQQRALLGNEQQQATGQVLGAMPNYARTNQVDMMKNLASSQAGERSALDLQAIAESIARNRQSLLTAGQLAGSVGAPGQVRQNDVPALMGQLATTYFQQQAYKQANQQGNGSVPAGGWGGSGQVAQVGGASWFPGMPQPGAQTVQPPAVSTGPQSGMSGFLGAWGGMLGQPGVAAPAPLGPFPVQSGPVPSQNVAAALQPPAYNINGFTQQPLSALAPMGKKRKKAY